MDEQTPVEPTTTKEQDRKTAGQRKINRIWELTQMTIALGVIFSTLIVLIALALLAIRANVTKDMVVLANTALISLVSMASLVIGFYFGRTNHTRLGDDQTVKERDDV